ncbi:MAG: c-type cytochrome [Bacteroidota bacterium]
MIRTAQALLRSFFAFSVVFYFSQCSQVHELPPGDADNGGLFLPENFEAVVVADSTGSARHMAVSDIGDIYIKLRSPTPKGILAIRDTNHDGKADSITTFGDYFDTGSYGTAMRIHNGYLYFSTAGEVYRIKLTPGKLIPKGKVDTILIDDYKHDKHGYEHIAKPIALDDKGNIYVPFGAPGDVCQVMNRIPGSPGEDPCSQLEEHGGIWKFDANKTGQTQKDGSRYATGIRSIVAMEWNRANNNLYVVAHGRDDLNARNPNLFTRWQSATLPSEEFLRVKEGTNAGWPYYYYDEVKGKRMLNPEYGGDGINTGKGDQYDQPIMGFPAHWAPNDLFFYTGNQFPSHYKNGAFIAFHGSTNRAPYPQAGYFVAFVPFENARLPDGQGNPTGKWEVFADGFAGIDPIVNVSDAKYRPMGIAMGPDGSLYLTETVKGKIWRVMYKGKKDNFGDEQLAKMELRKSFSNIRTPHEIEDNLAKGELVGGEKIYGTYCGVCHQQDGRGASGRFPPLAGTPWVTGDKQKLIGILMNGLEGQIEVKGEIFNSVMPKHSFLTNEEMANVLTYIRQNFGNKASAISAKEINEIRNILNTQ